MGAAAQDHPLRGKTHPMGHCLGIKLYSPFPPARLHLLELNASSLALSLIASPGFSTCVFVLFNALAVPTGTGCFFFLRDWAFLLIVHNNLLPEILIGEGWRGGTVVMPILLEYYKPGLSARRRAGICLFLCCISAF